ncbi:unnamed protein product [Paramecium primaurelia]|uniref:Uncharacterized protein n=1 Tax=Paramecium primaurelia TaxID=5886 RepID=A0A8S1LT68_PARPR|nr:unnamed protein product [Paramecium primaurelia]
MTMEPQILLIKYKLIRRQCLCTIYNNLESSQSLYSNRTQLKIIESVFQGIWRESLNNLLQVLCQTMSHMKGYDEFELN